MPCMYMCKLNILLWQCKFICDSIVMPIVKWQRSGQFYHTIYALTNKSNHIQAQKNNNKRNNDDDGVRLQRQQHQQFKRLCHMCWIITRPICYVCMELQNVWSKHMKMAYIVQCGAHKWKINCLNFRQYYWIRWATFCQCMLRSFLLPF